MVAENAVDSEPSWYKYRYRGVSIIATRSTDSATRMLVAMSSYAWSSAQGLVPRLARSNSLVHAYAFARPRRSSRAYFGAGDGIGERPGPADLWTRSCHRRDKCGDRHLGIRCVHADTRVSTNSAPRCRRCRGTTRSVVSTARPVLRALPRPPLRVG